MILIQFIVEAKSWRFDHTWDVAQIEVVLCVVEQLVRVSVQLVDSRRRVDLAVSVNWRTYELN